VSLVVTDTGPLHYLILIGRVDLLTAIYDRVFVPPAVVQELKNARTPEVVRQWVSAPPSWLAVESPSTLLILPRALDAGEHEAISLAVELQADMILLDDEAARRVAAALNLPFVGTLGVLHAAAMSQVLSKQDAEAAVAALTRTNKRLKPRIVQEALARIHAL
jgi:predicted nucleic acid-binding protein